MVKFYKNLKSGNDKPTSLQMAQLTVRNRWIKEDGKEFGHPYFWVLPSSSDIKNVCAHLLSLHLNRIVIANS